MSIDYLILIGNSISMRISCPMHGASYPKKWLEKEYNSYTFELSLNTIEDIKIEGSKFSGKIKISISEHFTKNLVRLDIENTCTVTCIAKNISATNINGFHNDSST